MDSSYSIHLVSSCIL